MRKGRVAGRRRPQSRRSLLSSFYDRGATATFRAIGAGLRNAAPLRKATDADWAKVSESYRGTRASLCPFGRRKRPRLLQGSYPVYEMVLDAESTSRGFAQIWLTCWLRNSGVKLTFCYSGARRPASKPAFRAAEFHGNLAADRIGHRDGRFCQDRCRRGRRHCVRRAAGDLPAMAGSASGKSLHAGSAKHET